MKKTIQLLLLVAFGLLSCPSTSGQNNGTWLERYMNGDTMQAQEALLKQYLSADNYGKRDLLEEISTQLEGELINERRDRALALTSLYLSIAEETDAKIPVMYYIAGEIYAGLNDTVRLKNCISGIAQYAKMTRADVDNLINSLNDYLIRYRNVVPTIDELTGFWIANHVSSNFSVLPQFVMSIQRINKDSVSVEILPYCSFSYKISSHLYSSNKSQYSKLIKTFSTDSLYILWSSKKIVNGSALSSAGVNLLRNTTSEVASTIVGKYSQRHKYTIKQQFTTNLVTGVAEIGVNLLLDELFMPKSRDYLLEMRLSVQNSKLMKGSLVYLTSVTRGDGRNKTNTDKFNINLIKWDSCSNVAFTDERKPLLPDGMDVKRFRKDTTTEYYQAFSMRRSRSPKFQYLYNQLQFVRLILYDDSVLRASGIEETGFFNNDSAKCLSIIGIHAEDITPHIKSKYSLRTTEGVMVDSISKGSPASVTPLHRGDVIMNIDGQAIRTSQDITKAYGNQNKRIKLTVLRGNKTETIYVWPLSTLYRADKKE